jgi:hypothetical protein
MGAHLRPPSPSSKDGAGRLQKRMQRGSYGGGRQRARPGRRSMILHTRTYTYTHTHTHTHAKTLHAHASTHPHSSKAHVGMLRPCSPKASFRITATHRETGVPLAREAPEQRRQLKRAQGIETSRPPATPLRAGMRCQALGRGPILRRHWLVVPRGARIPVFRTSPAQPGQCFEFCPDRGGRDVEEPQLPRQIVCCLEVPLGLDSDLLLSDLLVP